MSELGKILQKLFPVFIAKMVELSNMKDKAKRMKFKYELRPVGCKISIERLEKYYTLVYDFHEQKYWFMGDIPTLGHNNKVL